MKGVNAFRIYFMVIGLFALVVFTIYSFSSLTGNVVLAQCTDSDSSLVSSYPEEGSIYVKGVVVGLSSVGDGNTISKEDYCTTKDGYPYLAEMHCSTITGSVKAAGVSISCRY